MKRCPGACCKRFSTGIKSKVHGKRDAESKRYLADTRLANEQNLKQIIAAKRPINIRTVKNVQHGQRDDEDGEQQREERTSQPSSLSLRPCFV